MSTPALNLTLPVHTSSREYRWMTGDERIAYETIEKARKTVLIGLFQAISPELASLKPASGSVSEMFSFSFGGTYGDPKITVGFTKNGQLEVRFEASYRSGANTFRRFSVDPKTGAINPRIVESVKELVAMALEWVKRNAESKVRADAAKTQKAADFAHATEVVTANGAKWQHAYNEEGSLDLGSFHTARVVGRQMNVELRGLDIDRLPELMALLKKLA